MHPLRINKYDSAVHLLIKDKGGLFRTTGYDPFFSKLFHISEGLFYLCPLATNTHQPTHKCRITTPTRFAMPLSLF